MQSLGAPRAADLTEVVGAQWSRCAARGPFVKAPAVGGGWLESAGAPPGALGAPPGQAAPELAPSSVLLSGTVCVNACYSVTHVVSSVRTKTGVNPVWCCQYVCLGRLPGPDLAPRVCVCLCVCARAHARACMCVCVCVYLRLNREGRTVLPLSFRALPPSHRQHRSPERYLSTRAGPTLTRHSLPTSVFHL